MCDYKPSWRETDLIRVDEIIDKYINNEGILIQLLLDLQSEFNWIPEEVISRVSERLGIPRSQIYRIASFYKAMSLSPVGRHVIQVCMGTACKVRGAQKILDLTESKLRIKEGETTPDTTFSLKKVNCLGCCALGPVIVVDEDYHGNVASEAVTEILLQYD
ncbi:MAG: NADH-quinone oxidoreductase subunit NuoE [Methanotrichaceae archaeon]|nr:NADH-quinone oxidoreductase subunit NuoE [Methanotrichaceae archaeon]